MEPQNVRCWLSEREFSNLVIVFFGQCKQELPKDTINRHPAFIKLVPKLLLCETSLPTIKKQRHDEDSYRDNNRRSVFEPSANALRHMLCCHEDMVTII
jgi:hypothetical protein